MQQRTLAEYLVRPRQQFRGIQRTRQVIGGGNRVERVRQAEYGPSVDCISVFRSARVDELFRGGRW
jgi:hypothetical protein